MFEVQLEVKYGRFVKETILFYHKFANFTRIGDFTLRVSDCEELVGGLLSGDDVARTLVFEKYQPHSLIF